MDRRTFVSTVGLGATTAIAGCLGGGSDRGERTLVVGTYGSFVDAPSTSPGAWVKDQFESQFDARLVWQTPDADVNYYIERQDAGVDIEADLYVGLNTDQLVRIDDALEEPLFASAGDISGVDDVKSELTFDPEERAVPYGTGYVSPVYDGTATDAPETFDGLLDEEHRGDLIAQNPAGSTTGRAFLLHTIHQYGEDGYLDFWQELQDNDVRILGSWADSYSAWQGGEAPMVISYSTDQVFADMEGANLEEHQVRFLDDQAYANPEGMAVFENAAEPELAREFMSLLLEPEVQGELAERNVMFPATNDATLPEGYAELAHEPPEPVTFSYEELRGSVDTWVDDWERQVAEQ